MSITQQLRELIDCSIDSSIIKPGARVVLVEQIELAISAVEASQAVSDEKTNDCKCGPACEDKGHGNCRYSVQARKAPTNGSAAPSPQDVPEGMCLVTKEDGNNYCRILTALGMEEEGDAVAEVEALLAMRERLGPEPAAVQYTSQQAAREIRGSIIRRLEGFNEAYPQHWCGFLDDALGAAGVIADRLAAKGSADHG